MKADLLGLLRCPRCRDEHSFDLDATESDEREVRSGRLTCRACGHVASIEDGVVDLMHDPPDYVTREAAGLERFAEKMREDGWDRERILNLPYEQSGYWFAQGQRLLDVGSNTCWASNMFAQRGLDVIALDIAANQLQGLRVADWWFEG